MEELIARYMGELTGRVRGPFCFRYLLQPDMASFFALRAGMPDARTGKPPYFWAIVNDPSHRRGLLQDGWKDVAKVFILAVLLDTVYQLIRLRGIYPLQGLIVAFVLACLPYLVLRGAVRRIAGWWMQR